MGRKANVTTVFLIILMVLTLGLAGGGFYLFQKEKLRTQELEGKLEDLNKKQLSAEAALRKSKETVDELRSQLNDSKAQITALNVDLEQQKKDGQNSRSALAESQAKIAQLNEDLEAQKGRREDLEKKFTSLQEDVRKAEGKIKALDSQKVALESKVKELEAKTQEVELGKIVVNPDVSQAESKDYGTQTVTEKYGNEPQILGLQGKVLVINREYNFAVINLGSKDGIDVGDEFSIYRSNKYIGDIKVEKVHESMAAAGFLTGDMKDKVNEGDKVVQKVR